MSGVESKSKGERVGRRKGLVTEMGMGREERVGIIVGRGRGGKIGKG